MKLVYESLDQLFEIGEANVSSYDFKFMFKDVYDDVDYYSYSFTTEDNDNYEVLLAYNKTIHELTVGFTANNEADTYNVNKGRIFKVLSTVINVIKDVVNKNPDIKEILIDPSKETDEDNRRKNIYMAFIRKNMPPDWSVTTTKRIILEIEKEVILIKKS